MCIFLSARAINLRVIFVENQKRKKKNRCTNIADIVGQNCLLSTRLLSHPFLGLLGELSLTTPVSNTTNCFVFSLDVLLLLF